MQDERLIVEDEIVELDEDASGQVAGGAELFDPDCESYRARGTKGGF